MLKNIVDVLSKARLNLEEGTLFCSDVFVNSTTKECVEFLDENNIIENRNYKNELGENITLELSIRELNKVGYYYTLESLLNENKYVYPEKTFFVAELNKFSDEEGIEFYIGYKLLLRLIEALKLISKHNYTDVDVQYALIISGEKAILIPLYFGISYIKNLSTKDIEQIEMICSVFEEDNTEKKLLFINEIIEYLLPVTESVRFTTLLRTIVDFSEKCINAYQYYLRDFSYHKLKMELDSKALEFTQKIQAVINDSQTKLVTIPTAFVLVFAAFDYTDLNALKNFISIISLFIFAVLIQIFLNNQYSSLNFTEANVRVYKETFSDNTIEKFTENFTLVDNELQKQRARLGLITGILWLVPVSLLLTWVILYSMSKN